MVNLGEAESQERLSFSSSHQTCRGNLATCQTAAVRTQIPDPDLDLEGSFRILHLCFLWFPCRRTEPSPCLSLWFPLSSDFALDLLSLITLLAAAGNFGEVCSLFVCRAEPQRELLRFQPV